jgi:hypothetical protein
MSRDDPSTRVPGRGRVNGVTDRRTSLPEEPERRFEADRRERLVLAAATPPGRTDRASNGLDIVIAAPELGVDRDAVPTTSAVRVGLVGDERAMVDRRTRPLE